MKKILAVFAALCVVTAVNAQMIRLVTDVDQTWQAGTVHGTKFWSFAIAPGKLDTYLVRTDDATGAGFHVSECPLESNGNDADAFTLPFGFPSGEYNIRYIATSDAGEAVYYRSTGIITVTSTVTVKGMSDELRAGDTYTLEWAGSEPGIDSYDIYLVGGTLGDSGFAYLGAADARAGAVQITIPKHIKAGTGFEIQLSGKYASGANSDPYSIVQHRIK